MLTDILQNVAADLTVAAMATGAGYGLLRHQNRGLAHLLGAKGDRRILIVLPDLRVQPGGTAGNHRGTGYVGQAVARNEFEAVVALREMLSSPLARLVGHRRSGREEPRIGSSGPVEATVMCPPIADLQPALAAPEPLKALPGSLSGRSLLLIGGPAYNHLSDIALKHPACQAVPELQDGEWGLRLTVGSPRQFYAGRGPAHSGEIGLIAGFAIEEGGPTVTVCAGSSDIATRAALTYLQTHRKAITRVARGRSYSVLLSVDTVVGTTLWIAVLADGRSVGLPV
ncbi:hypothetical protein ACIBI4_13225 [Streptomyces sp. NPDC050418]|uniref:hypothetical protein n=1 Tax=Streptomyces sp. NPDC050418 TaxID=3365612 RepID=UPI003787A5D9